MLHYFKHRVLPVLLFYITVKQGFNLVLCYITVDTWLDLCYSVTVLNTQDLNCITVFHYCIHGVGSVLHYCKRGCLVLLCCINVNTALYLLLYYITVNTGLYLCYCVALV